MKVPEGNKCEKHKFCELSKIFYGLKQTVTSWLDSFENILAEKDLQKAPVDPWLYLSSVEKIF